MDRIVLGRKSPNVRRARVDRFIAPRDFVNDVRRRKRRASCDQKDLDIWFTKYQRKKKYTSYLDHAFGLEPRYQLQDSGPQSSVQNWPCLPRTKSYLSSADSILDLPYYSDAPFPELLDWSSDNILVAALGKRYHKWSWWSQSLTSQGLALDKIYCCKFDPTAELLALGTQMLGVEVHDNELSKSICAVSCKCKKTPYWDDCSITAIDWSPTGNSFATGCSSGVIVSYTRDTEYISWRYTAREAVVLMVRVSPDARHLAVAVVNRPNIVLLTWPTLEVHSNVVYEGWTIKTAVWHPWRSALLAVGMVGSYRTQISLWDAPTAKTREKILGSRGDSLDAMLFSHRTGELVLSMLNTERASYPRSCSQLVVMSDFDTVVDRCGEGRSGLDHVRTMVFSPDGTKLATATSDEDLIIWNFLPEDEKKKVKNRRLSAIPVYLDETTHGFSLR